MKNSNLPRLGRFFGRRTEARMVLNALSSETRAWIVCLTGVGGIGKTGLALHSAHEALRCDMFERAIWATAKKEVLTGKGVLASSSEYALSSLSDLLRVSIEILQLDPRLHQVSDERIEAAVLNELRTTPTLVVVDNLETVFDPRIVDFLQKIPPPSKALVTSRKFGDGSDSYAKITSLEGARRIPVGPLEQSDTVALLHSCMSQHDIAGSLGQDEIDRLIDSSGCIPLAVEWLVGSLTLNKHDIALSLEAYGGQVLAYCFDSLFDSIGARARRILLTLPAFSDYTLPEAIASACGVNLRQCGQVLDRLVRTSLVRMDRMTGRYGLLEPTRAYLLAKLRRYPDQLIDCRERAIEFYIVALKSALESDSCGRFSHERHNMSSLLDWSFQSGRYASAVRLARKLSPFFQRLCYWDQRVSVCQLGSRASRIVGNGSAAINFEYDAAEVHKQRGRLKLALSIFTECEALAYDSGEVAVAIRARMQRGVIAMHKGDMGDSQAILEQCVRQFEDLGDHQGYAMAGSNLARVLLRSGKADHAVAEFRRLLKYKIERRGRLDIAIGSYDLAHALHLAGSLVEAELKFAEAIDLLQEIGDERHLANARWYWAQFEADRGNINDAIQALQNVLRVEEKLQRDDRIARTRRRLSELEGEIESRHEAKAVQALVVSIGQYRNFPDDPLDGDTARDVFRVFCGAPSSKAHLSALLQDEQATTDAIRQEVSLLAESESTHVLLFLFVNVLRTRDGTYLCVAESDPERMDETAISGSELLNVLDRVAKARQVILVTDVAIQSAGAADDYGQLPMDFAQLLTSRNISILSLGCRHLDQKRRRITYRALLDGLNGKALVRTDSALYLRDLFHFLKTRVAAADSGVVRLLQPRSREDCVLQLSYRSLSDAKPPNVELTSIREAVIADPIQGSGMLSSYLSSRDPDLFNTVDLHRSALMRYRESLKKYSLLEPSLVSDRERRVYCLLEICTSLIENLRKLGTDS